MSPNVDSTELPDDSNSNDNKRSGCDDVPFSWRLHKDDSYSDWEIVIKANEKETTYNVHKCHLGVGPRKSEYFKKQFSTTLSNGGQCSSSINLEPMAADAFPMMLDYIYLIDENWKPTTELATALRWLANYFCVRGLLPKIEDFINDDLNLHTIPTYWDESITYHDEELFRKMMPIVAKNFDNLKMEFLLKINPDHLCEIVSSSDFESKSEVFSARLAKYLQSENVEVVGDQVRTLTSPDKMPLVAPEAALFFLKIDENYHCDELKGEQTLFNRCVKAFVVTEDSKAMLLTSEEFDSDDPNQTKKKKRTEYENLSMNMRLRLLEASLKYEKTENRKLKSSNQETLSNWWQNSETMKEHIDKLQSEKKNLLKERDELKEQNQALKEKLDITSKDLDRIKIKVDTECQEKTIHIKHLKNAKKMLASENLKMKAKIDELSGQRNKKRRIKKEQ